MYHHHEECKEKLRVVPFTLMCEVSRSCFTTRKHLSRPNWPPCFPFHVSPRKTVGKTLEMTLPDAGLKDFSFRFQRNSRAPHKLLSLDLREFSSLRVFGARSPEGSIVSSLGVVGWSSPTRCFLRITKTGLSASPSF